MKFKETPEIDGEPLYRKDVVPIRWHLDLALSLSDLGIFASVFVRELYFESEVEAYIVEFFIS